MNYFSTQYSLADLQLDILNFILVGKNLKILLGQPFLFTEEGNEIQGAQ